MKRGAMYLFQPVVTVCKTYHSHSATENEVVPSGARGTVIDPHFTSEFCIVRLDTGATLYFRNDQIKRAEPCT